MKVTFEGDLRDLVKKPAYAVQFEGDRSVKDLIQSLGVPHTEVGQIIVNGQPVLSSFLIRTGDQIQAFPPTIPEIPHSLPLLICDVHLWKLARRLRVLGIDTLFDPQWNDAQLANIAYKQKRILLSRDRGLLMRNQVEQGLLVRNTDPEKQVIEILSRLNIKKCIKPFYRCPVCNGILETVDTESTFFKTQLMEKIPKKVLEWHRQFAHCGTCKKVYWQGSHYKKLCDKIHSYL